RLRRPANVLLVVLEPELRSVDADHDEPAIGIGLVPRADVAERPQPVDAGVGPEVDEDDLPAQVVGPERRRVEPAGRVLEARETALARKRSGTGMPARAEEAHAGSAVTVSSSSARRIGT